jgi:hypothetical protein
LTDAKGLALATGAAAYRWEDLTKAPVSPSMLNPTRHHPYPSLASQLAIGCRLSIILEAL